MASNENAMYVISKRDLEKEVGSKDGQRRAGIGQK